MSPATSWTSIGSSGSKSKKVNLPEYVKADKKGSKWPVPDIFDKVPGGTIPDVYKLIKRTLNLGLPKPVPVAPPKVKSLEKAYQSSMKAYRQREEREAGIPWTKTPSLHRLHTEWDEDIINIEVLLGLKKPKNSREALAVMKQLESDASCTSSSGDGDGESVASADNSHGDSTEKQASRNKDSKAAVEDVDSGVASRGDSDTTN